MVIAEGGGGGGGGEGAAMCLGGRGWGVGGGDGVEPKGFTSDVLAVHAGSRRRGERPKGRH